MCKLPLDLFCSTTQSHSSVVALFIDKYSSITLHRTIRYSNPGCKKKSWPSNHISTRWIMKGCDCQKLVWDTNFIILLFSEWFATPKWHGHGWWFSLVGLRYDRYTPVTQQPYPVISASMAFVDPSQLTSFTMASFLAWRFICLLYSIQVLLLTILPWFRDKHTYSFRNFIL